MNGYTFLRPDDAAAPEVWRPLDRALAHWVRAHGGSAELAAVAAWASYADGMGDAAIALVGADVGRHGMPPLDDATITALRSEPLVGDGSVVTPFVLDAAGRFALWRNLAQETAIAGLLCERCAVPATPTRDDADLDVLFQGRRDAAVQRQRDAVAGVLGQRLFVLTGGPGTGKTTTVLRMLLQRLHHASAPLRIQVAAPTGKAAQRLVQALREGKRRLAEGGLPDAWQALFAQIPDAEALTLHRLLGFDPRRQQFARTRQRPLAADLVVVDEASMLDLPLLRALLDAVRRDACLILVGDADQLTSVGTGSVLMDLVAALDAAHAPQQVRLQHSFRADLPLARLNAAVRQGDAAAFLHSWDATAAARRLEVGSASALRQAATAWARALADLPLRPALPPAHAASGGVPAESVRAERVRTALGALAQRQLLCALRDEDFGALALDALIGAELKRVWGEPAEATWYAGRAVMVVRNDYTTRLFNGDVGLCLAEPDGTLKVWFDGSGADGAARLRAFAPAQLPPHEGAFAITVHKSQGSEYACVGLVLPPDPAHRILSRQLLYTGLSRARAEVQLWGSEAVVTAALQRPIRRIGTLFERLRDGLPRS